MLPDLLRLGLRLVVCGTAAGKRSARLQQYYAGHGNRFWRTLYEVRLTPVLLRSSEYERLLDYGIGLTDLVKGRSGMDSDLAVGDFGSQRLVEVVKQYQPRLLCFNGKRAAAEFLLRSVNYGPQPEIIDLTRLFVAPSTSSAANAFWDIQWWQELSDLCKS
jgi:TDG/mug DNA glycosylase family protein